MSSTTDTAPNGHSASNGELSAAQRVQQLHAAHNPEIEEVIDEADEKHPEQPLSNSVLEDRGEAPGWTPNMSAKAAGKRKETPQEKAVRVDDPAQFPSLGGSKPASAQADWPHGPKSTNATNGSSTPASGTRTPAEPPRKANLPHGHVRESYPLTKKQMLSRQELKKPLPEILKDINKKHRAVNVTQTATQDGINLVGVGQSRDAVNKALKDVISQIGAKV